MTQGGRLFVPLCTEPFLRFKAGTKTVEVRQESPRFNLGTVERASTVLLRRGYSTKDELVGHRARFGWSAYWDSLPAWAKEGAGIRRRPEKSPYFDPERPLIYFEVLL